MSEKPKNKSKKKVVKIGNSVEKVVISFRKTQRKGKIKGAKKFKIPREAAQLVVRTPKSAKPKATPKPKSAKPKATPKPKSAKPKATPKPKTVTPTPKKRVRKVVKHNRVPSKKKRNQRQEVGRVTGS